MKKLLFLLVFLVGCDNATSTTTTEAVTDTVIVNTTITNNDTVFIKDTLYIIDDFTGTKTYLNYDKFGEFTGSHSETFVNGFKTEIIYYNRNDAIILHNRYVINADGDIEEHKIV